MQETQKRNRFIISPIQHPATDGDTSRVDWKNLIDQHKLVPFVSNSICNQCLFKDRYEEVIMKWAAESGYPWPELDNVTAIAQYVLMSSNETYTRQKYLEYLKIELASGANEDQSVSDKQRKRISEKYGNPAYSVTDMAYDLGYLDFEKDENHNHPLSLLASLPFEVFFTTSYHRFLEVALFQAGKRPVSEMYPWNTSLEAKIHTIFQSNPQFKPTPIRPLVYHLFGRDDQLDSLVLSENDFLDLLIKISFDKGDTKVGAHENASGELIAHGLPGAIVNRLVQDSAPLLLGYELQDWDFRVLFRGLINATRGVRFGTGFYIQHFSGDQKDEEKIKTQLEPFLLTRSGLKIISSTVKDCVRELYNDWTKS